MGKSVYEMVTEGIIEQLENGVIPWENPRTVSVEAVLLDTCWG